MGFAANRRIAAWTEDLKRWAVGESDRATESWAQSYYLGVIKAVMVSQRYGKPFPDGLLAREPVDFQHGVSRWLGARSEGPRAWRRSRRELPGAARATALAAAATASGVAKRHQLLDQPVPVVRDLDELGDHLERRLG